MSFELFCHDKNCYELLEIDSSATSEELSKSFRRLSKKWHPDKHKQSKEAETRYSELTNAYEVLRDPILRADYDDYLANPYDHPSYLYQSQYMFRRYGPKINPLLVIIVSLIVLSAFQYFNQNRKHSRAIDYFYEQSNARDNAFRQLPETIADGIPTQLWTDKKLQKKLKPEELTLKLKAIENEIKNVISKQIHGGYRPASMMKDLLLVQIILLPYTLANYFYFELKWFYDFEFLKKPFGPKERILLTRRALKMSVDSWENESEEDRERWVQEELWVPENLKNHLNEKESKEKDTGNYKRYKRYLKKQQ